MKRIGSRCSAVGRSVHWICNGNTSSLLPFSTSLLLLLYYRISTLLYINNITSTLIVFALWPNIVSPFLFFSCCLVNWKKSKHPGPRTTTVQVFQVCLCGRSCGCGVNLKSDHSLIMWKALIAAKANCGSALLGQFLSTRHQIEANVNIIRRLWRIYIRRSEYRTMSVTTQPSFRVYFRFFIYQNRQVRLDYYTNMCNKFYLWRSFSLITPLNSQ